MTLPSVPRPLLVVANAVLLVVVLVVGASCASPLPPGASPADGETTISVAAAPVDFSRPGPYPVGTRTMPIVADPCPADPATAFGCPRSAVVFYPADAESAGTTRRITGYSTALAFPDTLRALVPAELVQDVTLGIDVFDAPVVNDEGPFPIVLHSHGFGGYYRFESRFMAHLASWGFVVASPDHQERSLAGQLTGRVPATDADVDDLRRTLEVLEAENVAEGVLHGGVDPSRVAASGHSAGAAAVVRMASAGRLATVIGKAPSLPVTFRAEEAEGGPSPDRLTEVTPPGIPTLLIASELDGVIPLASVRAEYDWLRPSKRLVVLRGAGHNAYTDLCQPIRDRGGLMQYAEELPALVAIFRLGEDGCTPDRLEPSKGEALIDHLAVAHLRRVLGLDPTDASLTPAFLEARFPEALATVEYA